MDEEADAGYVATMSKTPIFISWSGPRAQAVGKALCAWIPKVLQAAAPWCSTEMEAGERWSPEIARRLTDARIGVLCVTPENYEAPWLLFEAGALAKSIDRARVIPYFLGMKPTDIKSPLTQFQGKVADRAGTLDVVRSINSTLEEPNGEGALTEIFDALYGKLEAELVAIPAAPKPTAPKREVGEMVEEALSILRKLDSRDRREGTRTWASEVVREHVKKLRADTTEDARNSLLRSIDEALSESALVMRKGKYDEETRTFAPDEDPDEPSASSTGTSAEDT